MSTASPTHENLGLTIDLWQPTFALSGSNPTTALAQVWGNHLATFNAPTQLSWSSQADGGFENCSWAIAGNMQDLDRWLQEGLGAHVEIRDETDTIRWEGRVNQIQCTAGGLRWSWGPLLEISNQVGVRYNVLDTTTMPPTEGEQTFYGWREIADSQQRYGIAQTVLSGGGMSLTTALSIAYTWAFNRAFPIVSSDVSLGAQSGQITVQFQALGYVSWLQYLYNDTTVTGTLAASAQIGSILDADPNGFFSSANAEIFPTVFPGHYVENYEGQDRKAWDLIVANGHLVETATNRLLSRVGPGRLFSFLPAPGYAAAVREPNYLISLGESGHWQVRDGNGALVRPWAVDSGTFAMMTDILPGREFLDTITPNWWQQDPRLMFVERVQFTAPDQLQLQSGSIVDIESAVKAMGLGQAS